MQKDIALSNRNFDHPTEQIEAQREENSIHSK
jgi:hypothetical protein